jgi:hypothetical protein
MKVPRRAKQEQTPAGGEAQPLIDDTIDVWQPYTSRRLTREDARQITENVCGFFNVLLEWTRAERRPTSRSRRDVDRAD